jgi:hypothetical protein
VERLLADPMPLQNSRGCGEQGMASRNSQNRPKQLVEAVIGRASIDQRE